MHTVAGDGVAGIKRRRCDLSSDGVRNLVTTSGLGRLKEDLELSTWLCTRIDNSILKLFGHFIVIHFISPLFFLIIKEFGDSYQTPSEETGKGSTNESSAKKKGRTVVITTKDMQKRRNDVKERTTLLLALLDEHQLRFSNGKSEVHTASVPTASVQVSTASTNVAAASLSHDTVCAYIASQSNGF
nr:hypothetical protein [Tanacetum cinerariifolium]